MPSLLRQVEDKEELQRIQLRIEEIASAYGHAAIDRADSCRNEIWLLIQTIKNNT